jgi:hypothetical protein
MNLIIKFLKESHLREKKIEIRDIEVSESFLWFNSN